MSDLRKAAEQALEALENAKSYDKEDLFGFDDEITALCTALETEQETTPKKGSYDAVFGHLGMTPDELGNYMVALQQQPVMFDINAMVDRFLAWKLPQDFHPDSFIIFDRAKHDTWGGCPNSWPTGTNLLTAAQAKAMLEHVIEYAPHNIK